MHAQSSSALDLSLHASAAEVRHEGALRLAVVFRNGDAQQTLALRGSPDFAEGGGLQLTVIDAGGTRRVVAIPATGVRSPNPAGAERVQILPPGHGTSVHRRNQATMLFPTTGHYRLEVSYTPPADSPTALPAGSVAASAAVSGQVEIEVTE